MTVIDYWFSLGSTYNFLTAMRLEAIERETGIAFRWRPFNMAKILREMNNIPFSGKPAKAAYMWRDVGRRADKYGLVHRLPAAYPAQQTMVGTQLAFLGMREGWGKAFVRACYASWFQEGGEPYVDPVLSRTLSGIGQDPARAIAVAASDENLRLLEEETDEARRLGIFGAPTFAVGGELFWGDDRLEDAIAWHRRGTLKPDPHASP
jgi:2-hydroxychromene-2-carboxylate isomerase